MAKLYFFIYSQQTANVPMPPPGSTYAPGMNILSETQAAKRVPAQAHPLKSFTVPAPPPISAPGTPQPKHIGNYIFVFNHICVCLYHVFTYS